MLYLAMTAAEIAAKKPLPSPLAYMACHFSAYGAGLSNIPETLPEGSILILNDRTPIMGHDPKLVAAQLKEAAERLGCSRLLLDFQRAGEPETFPILEEILSCVSCPTAVSEAYARELSCPVFLPPVPLCKPLCSHLAPWEGREVWLEVSADAVTATLTESGCRFAPCPAPNDTLPHFDRELFCHYGLELTQNSAVFTVHRTWEDLQTLMQSQEITCFVGLYQELSAQVEKGTP